MAALKRAMLAAGSLALPAGAEARLLGEDAAACIARDGPAIQVAVTGLKNRDGALKLELYPANEADFLAGDRALLAAGKVFRRVRAVTPADGTITLCIRAPRPGRYALFFTHDLDGKNKFNFWVDGAGVPSNRKLGRARPRLSDGTVEVGRGIANVAIRAQYLRGIVPKFGFLPR